MRRDAGLDMLGQHFQLSGETEVPEFAAIFLIGRKMADYGYLSEESKKDKMFRDERRSPFEPLARIR